MTNPLEGMLALGVVPVPVRRPKETVGTYMERSFFPQQEGPEPSTRGLVTALMRTFTAIGEPLELLDMSFHIDATDETQRRIHRVWEPASLKPLNPILQGESPENGLSIYDSVHEALSHVQLTPDAARNISASMLELRRQLLAYDRDDLGQTVDAYKRQIVAELAASDLRFRILGPFSRRYRESRLQQIEDEIQVITPQHSPNEPLALALERLASETQKPGQVETLSVLSATLLNSLEQFGISPIVMMASLQMAVEEYYIDEAQPQQQ